MAHAAFTNITQGRKVHDKLLTENLHMTADQGSKYQDPKK